MAELITVPAGAARPNPLSLTGIKAMAAQPAIARALPALGLLGVAGAAALAWSVIAAPPQRALFSGLDDGEKAGVVEALSGAGVAYEIDRDTGSVTVGEDDYHRARMLLAAEGLPKGAPDAGSMLDSMPMGASRAVEDQRLRGAREQDLARTIEAIEAVQAARVHLAFETPSVFVRERSAPAASVMLQLTKGRTLSDAQVAAIAHLVSSSVPGLDAGEVAIVDQNGRLLSRGGGVDPAASASDRQIEVQERIEARYNSSLEKLLAPLVGAGNFTAEVHADLDFAETSATRETYPKADAVVAAERGETQRSAGAEVAMGIPGALSNTAPTASALTNTAPGQNPAQPGTTAAQNDGKMSETYNRTFALGREVSVTRNPVGTVKRLTIAVALRDNKDAKISQGRLQQIEALVRGAVGFNAARGDLVAVNVQPFASETLGADAPAWYEAAWLATLARSLSAVLVALLLVLFIGRPLLKRHAAAAKERAEEKKLRRQQIGKQMAGAIADHARDTPAATGQITIDMIESAPGYAMRAELIRDFVRQDPARAALVVRDLIRAEQGGEDARNG